jgi:hypothetical protein
MDEACKMIGGLYDCISRISKFAHLTADRLHIIEKRLNAVSQYALVKPNSFWRPYPIGANGPHQHGDKYRESPSTFDTKSHIDTQGKEGGRTQMTLKWGKAHGKRAGQKRPKFSKSHNTMSISLKY